MLWSLYICVCLHMCRFVYVIADVLWNLSFVVLCNDTHQTTGQKQVQPTITCQELLYRVVQ